MRIWFVHCEDFSIEILPYAHHEFDGVVLLLLLLLLKLCYYYCHHCGAVCTLKTTRSRLIDTTPRCSALYIAAVYCVAAVYMCGRH
jgi:hypothetical protein